MTKIDPARPILKKCMSENFVIERKHHPKLAYLQQAILLRSLIQVHFFGFSRVF